MVKIKRKKKVSFIVQMGMGLNRTANQSRIIRNAG
jgi:hypothetical protein